MNSQNTLAKFAPQLLRDLADLLADPQCSGVVVWDQHLTYTIADFYELRHHPEARRKVLWIATDPAFSDTPYMALTAYLRTPGITGGMHSEDANNVVNLPGDTSTPPTGIPIQHLDFAGAYHGVRTYLEHLRNGADRPVVLLERPTDLDQQSLLVLTQLARDGHLQIVLVARSRRDLHSDIARLYSAGNMRELTVESLDKQATRKVCQELLGGLVPDSISDILFYVTAGSLVFLQQLIHRLRERGHLVTHDGVWAITTDHDWHEHVDELVRAWFEKLSHEQGELLKTIALAHQLPRDILLQYGVAAGPLVDSARLDDLVAAGILMEVQGDNYRVRIPLISQWIHANTTPITKMHLWRTVGHHLSLDVPPRTFLARINWALSCYQEVDQRVLFRGAKRANWLGHRRLARSLTERITDPGLKVRTQIQYARSLMLDEGPAVALAALPAPAEVATPNEADDYLSLMGELQFSAQESSEQWHQVMDMWISIEPERGYMAAQVFRGLQLIEHGHYGEIDKFFAEPYAPQLDSDDPEVRLIALLVQGQSQYMRGQASRGLKLLQQAFDTVMDHWDLTNYGTYTFVRLSLAYVYECAWDKLERLLSRVTIEHAPWMVNLSGFVELLRAIEALQLGNLPQAQTALQQTRALLQHADPVRALPLALVLSAYVSYQNQQPQQVSIFLDDLDRLPYSGTTFMSALVENYRVHLQTTGMELADRLAAHDEIIVRRLAQENLLAAAEQALQRSRVAPFEPRDYERITAALSPAKGRRFLAVHKLMYALYTRQAMDFLQAGRVAFDHGIFSIGLEALTHALTRARFTRELEVVTEIYRLLGEYRVKLGSGYATIVGLTRHLQLTTRENDVMRLLVHGMTSKEIAEKLFLSPRTVDGHIQRVLDKTGLKNRRELAGLYRDLLDP